MNRHRFAATPIDIPARPIRPFHYEEDTSGHKLELRYLLDLDGREIDFVILRDRKPLFAVECKSGDVSASSACEQSACDHRLENSIKYIWV